MERVAEEAERAAHQNNLKEIYTKTKLRGYLKKPSTGIRTKEGNVITTEEEVLERWKEHFYEILNVFCEEADLTEGCQLGDCEDPIDMDTGPFTIQELRQVISRLKNGKAPGVDKKKASPPIALDQLLNICRLLVSVKCYLTGGDLCWPKYPRKVIRLFVTATEGYPYFHYNTKSSAECS